MVDIRAMRVQYGIPTNTEDEKMTDTFTGFEDMHELPPADQCRTSRGPHTENIGGIEIPGFEEKCGKCNGTGTFRSYTGRTVGNCFKCKGAGKLVFKTAPDARAKSRKYAKNATTRKAEVNAGTFRAWAKEHGLAQWFADNATNDFAQSLYTAGLKYGSLTENQAKAVYTAMARDEDGKVGFAKWCEAYPGVMDWLQAESKTGNEFAGSLLEKGVRFGTLSDGQLNAVLRNVEQVKSDGPESELDLSVLVKGYYAVPDGDTRLKLAIRRPGKDSRYHGWTFVDDGAAYGSRTTYGKQAPEGTYKGRCQDQLRAIIADPLAAMVAYGKLTGTCGKCGRILEDEESVAAGIGPVCATKM